MRDPFKFGRLVRTWKDDIWDLVVITSAVGIAMLIFFGVTGGSL
jgi:hypothetical protein